MREALIRCEREHGTPRQQPARPRLTQKRTAKLTGGIRGDAGGTAVGAAGSVIVFNGQCWHGGGANNSDHDRHALFGHYRKSMLMFQLDPHDGFPTEWFDDLTARQRELMRMTGGPGHLHAADAHAWKGKV